jgi:anion-transporting  ArsA/GET3 family ATPase
VAEVADQDRLARAFGAPDSHFREVELLDGLWTISIDPHQALEEYLRIQIRVKALADLLFSSRMFQYFAVATPGMSELVTMGKVWELAQLERRARGGSRYDLVIVDAPATGHGMAIMRTPRTFADIARVGPVAQQGRAIDATVRDRSHTGVVAVSLPEEMPVNETLMLRDGLAEEMGLDVDLLVVNGLYPDRFTRRHLTALRKAADDSPAVRAALAADTRARGQREQVARLEEAMGLEPVRLPFLFEPEMGPDQFEDLSHVLEEAL